MWVLIGTRCTCITTMELEPVARFGDMKKLKEYVKKSKLATYKSGGYFNKQFKKSSLLRCFDDWTFEEETEITLPINPTM